MHSYEIFLFKNTELIGGFEIGLIFRYNPKEDIYQDMQNCPHSSYLIKPKQQTAIFSYFYFHMEATTRCNIERDSHKLQAFVMWRELIGKILATGLSLLSNTYQVIKLFVFLFLIISCNDCRKDGLNSEEQSKLTDSVIIHYKDSTIHIVYHVEDSLLHGKYLFYYKSGRLFTEGYYKKGWQSGVWKYYYENGEVSEIGKYDQNELDTSLVNKVHLTKQQSSDCHFISSWNTHQAYKKEGEAPRVGIWSEYFKNGAIKAKGKYLPITFCEFEIDPDTFREIEWVHYPKDSIWNYWDSTGKLIRQEFYKNGMMVDSTIFNK
ncbi:MAG: hypothetical protein WD048_11035 [Chitinophagales bacterium]